MEPFVADPVVRKGHDLGRAARDQSLIASGGETELSVRCRRRPRRDLVLQITLYIHLLLQAVTPARLRDFVTRRNGVMRERTKYQVDRVVVQNTSGSTFWEINRASPCKCHAPDPDPDPNSDPNPNHRDVCRCGPRGT